MNAVNKIEQHNPIGTDGFEFVEFTAPNAEGIEQLRTLFTQMGFTETAKHRSKEVWLFQQHDINIVLNGNPTGHVREFGEARPERLRHGLPGEECRAGRCLRRIPGRQAGRQPRQLRRAEHPLRRRHRRLAALSRRPLRRQEHLRRRLRVHRRAHAERQCRRPDVSIT